MIDKLKVIIRQCNTSHLRKKEVRPEWFSYEDCYTSIVYSGIPTGNIHVLVDGTKANHHFQLYDYDYITEYVGGSDAKSFKFCLNYIEQQNFDDDDIIYIVEDDYLHKNDWEYILVDVFKSFKIDYVSLYDHPDKYFLPMYKDLQSTILVSNLAHWRTTPSTCNTYAAKMKTFRKHWDIHMKYCSDEHTHDGYDHTKFLNLWEAGSNLVTSIPAYSTHCEKAFISPVIEWNHINE